MSRGQLLDGDEPQERASDTPRGSRGLRSRVALSGYKPRANDRIATYLLWYKMIRLKIENSSLSMLRNLQILGKLAGIAFGLVVGSEAISPTWAANPEMVSRSAVWLSQFSAPSWRGTTAEEDTQIWDYLLNSPLGIAALNQLAIEGFISPICPKTFYINDEFGGFQFMLRVQCPDDRGISTAVGYREMRVIFNRFEGNIENFSIERVGDEMPPTVPLP